MTEIIRIIEAEQSMIPARLAFRLAPALRTGSLLARRQLSDRPTDIGLAELKEKINKKDILLIDVREPTELQAYGVLPGAINIPLGEVPYALSLSPEAFERHYGVPFEPKKLVFSCKLGVRSEKARQAAEKEGYHDARNFLGGFDLWSETHGSGSSVN
uniref:Rhodanese domain-containing protein n=1 Tax=Plectus sambesii TaxID=2011161 RepID=A0A914W813_9BILA